MNPPSDERRGVAIPRLADLSLRFWMSVVVTGMLTGIGAMVLMGILRFVEHTALRYHSGEFSTVAAHRSDLRLVVVLAVGGLVTGLDSPSCDGTAAPEGSRPVWSGPGGVACCRCAPC